MGSRHEEEDERGEGLRGLCEDDGDVDQCEKKRARQGPGAVYLVAEEARLLTRERIGCYGLSLL